MNRFREVDLSFPHSLVQQVRTAEDFNLLVDTYVTEELNVVYTYRYPDHLVPDSPKPSGSVAHGTLSSGLGLASGLASTDVCRDQRQTSCRDAAAFTPSSRRRMLAKIIGLTGGLLGFAVLGRKSSSATHIDPIYCNCTAAYPCERWGTGYKYRCDYSFVCSHYCYSRTWVSSSCSPLRC
jgi:hypothetical protein